MKQVDIQRVLRIRFPLFRPVMPDCAASAESTPQSHYVCVNVVCMDNSNSPGPVLSILQS